MKQKKNVILFVVTMTLSLIILCFFVTGYYSIDTPWIYSRGYIDYAIQDAYVRDGRLFSALIFFVIGLINPTIVTVYIINIIIAIIILTLCVIQIYNFIARYKNLEKRKHKIIAFMISYTYIFNFLIVDILKYIDSFIISTSILLFIIAIKKIIIEKKNKKGLLLTILGVICYQGTIPVFIATAILITLLENKAINKKYFIKILPCAVSIIIAGLCSVAIVNIIPIITQMSIAERLDGINYIQNIEQNLQYIGGQLIFKCAYMFPPYAWLAISLFILVITAIYSIRNKKVQIFINVLVIFMLYIGSMILMTPVIKLWIAPRGALVMGEVISAMILYLYCIDIKETNMKIFQKILESILVIYFICTIFSVLKSSYEFKLANKLDEEFAKKVEKEIINLEEKGIYINKIGINYTGNGVNIKKYAKIVKQDSKILNGLYSLEIYEFYTGRTIKSSAKLLTDAEKEIYFSSSSNDKIQFKNVEDILYVLVDL